MLKKILLILLLFYVVDVQALSYSDYSDFGDYSDSYIQSDDLTDVKVERRYKYYKENKIFGPYISKDEVSDRYPLLLEDDFLYSDYSDLSAEMPSLKEGRVIEKVQGYKYKKLKPVNYLKLYNYEVPLKLENLEIKYKGENIDYTTEGKTDNFLNTGEYLKFNFAEKIDVNDLVLTFNYSKGNEGSAIFSILTGDSEIGHTVDTYAYYNNESYLKWEGMYSSIYNDESLFYYFYSDKKIFTTFVVRLVGQTDLYKYKDTMYHSYRLEKEYYPDYLAQECGEYEYKDESDYKDYYAKRIRNLLPEKRSLNSENLKSLESKVEPLVKGLKTVEPEEKAAETSKAEITEPARTSKVIYKPVIQAEKEENCNNLYLFIFVLGLIGIIILLLSKRYKKKK